MRMLTQFITPNSLYQLTYGTQVKNDLTQIDEKEENNLLHRSKFSVDRLTEQKISRFRLNRRKPSLPCRMPNFNSPTSVSTLKKDDSDPYLCSAD